MYTDEYIYKPTTPILVRIRSHFKVLGINPQKKRLNDSVSSFSGATSGMPRLGVLILRRSPCSGDPHGGFQKWAEKKKAQGFIAHCCRMRHFWTTSR